MSNKVCQECGGNGAGGAHEDDCEYAQPSQIPEGYKLVPIDPTDEMLEAAAKSGGLGMNFYEYKSRVALSYKAMLEAAPEPKEQ